jgi:copper chaperone CopZ
MFVLIIAHDVCCLVTGCSRESSTVSKVKSSGCCDDNDGYRPRTIATSSCCPPSSLNGPVSAQATGCSRASSTLSKVNCTGCCDGNDGCRPRATITSSCCPPSNSPVSPQATGCSRASSTLSEIKSPRCCEDNGGCRPRTVVTSSCYPQPPGIIHSKPATPNNCPVSDCCNQLSTDLLSRCCSSCCDYFPPSLSKELDGPVRTLTFNVEGLTCSSCESTMKEALLDIKGVDLASVSVILGRAVIEGSATAENIIRQAT